MTLGAGGKAEQGLLPRAAAQHATRLGRAPLACPGAHQTRRPTRTEVDFVSADANDRWDVYSDDEVACTTPCSKWVDASRPILLRAREDGFLAAPDKIQMTDLGAEALAGPLQVQAHPTSRGELLTGITFTSFGGLALLTGITLSAVGCSSGNSDGMCQGGLISLGAGSLVTAGALWLIFDSAPRANVMPARASASGGRW